MLFFITIAREKLLPVSQAVSSTEDGWYATTVLDVLQRARFSLLCPQE